MIIFPSKFGWKKRTSTPLYLFMTLLNLWLFSITSLAQISEKEANSGIEGIVMDYNSSQRLSGVLIMLQGTSMSTRTDSVGAFQFQSLSGGKYEIVAMLSNYYTTISHPVPVLAGQISRITLQMLPGDPEKFLYFSIGGITVTANRDLIPESYQTTYEISSGEIQHIQATHLGDVLDQIPGVIRKSRPGLESRSFIALRGAEAQVSYDYPEIFGTRIIVDNIPVSNNSNMNQGYGVGYGSQVPTNVDNGIDLRRIAADNIENVEVVVGVPSAEYGDLTNGLINVHTVSGVTPFRLKAKTNPDTREMNMNGGFRLNKFSVLNANLNYTYSERNLRIDGDEVSRLSTNINLDHKFPGIGMSMKNRIYFSRLFEDYELRYNPQQVRAWARDYLFNFGNTFEKSLGQNSRLQLDAFLNYTRRKDYQRKLQVSDPVYLSNLMEPGTQEGFLIFAPYYSEVNTIGSEYLLGLKLKVVNSVPIIKMHHRFLWGMEYNYEDNKGIGRQFDPLKPPEGKIGERPRSFDDVPGFTHLSFFVEDHISGKYYIPYLIGLGLRSEMYNPESLGGKNLIRSRNGTFWNPRIGLLIKPTSSIHLRSAYGISSKAPALYKIYPEPVYYDILEWGRDPNNPTSLDSIALVTTQVYRMNNPNLQGFKQRKFELGFDIRRPSFGISVTGYWQKTTGTMNDVELPFVSTQYFWPNWPVENGKILRNQQYILLSGFAYQENIGRINSQGIEILLKTHRLSSLNMIFNCSASYNYKRTWFEHSLDVDAPRSFMEVGTPGDTVMHFGYPMFPYTSRWHKNLILNYGIDYINQTLGIWIRINMFHRLFDQERDVDLPSLNNYAYGYYENGQYYFISQQQAKTLGLSKTLIPGQNRIYRKPVAYYFNLSVSKIIYRGTEISVFFNNFMNQRLIYTDQYGFSVTENPEIFYGVELSVIFDNFARNLTRKLF
jgi:hypothetical protein